MNKNKKIMIGTMCAYVGLGLVASVIFFSDSDIYGVKKAAYVNSDEKIAGDEIAIKKEINIQTGNDIEKESFAGNIGNTKEPETAMQEPEAAIPDSESIATKEGTVAEAETKTEKTQQDEEKKYYSFKVKTTGANLRIRKEPDVNSEMVGFMLNGEKGYVVEKGDVWSEVVCRGIRGYSANEFLIMTEIPKENLPADFPME